MKPNPVSRILAALLAALFCLSLVSCRTPETQSSEPGVSQPDATNPTDSATENASGGTPAPVNEALAFFTPGTELELPENPGAFLLLQAQALLDAVREKTGVTLLRRDDPETERERNVKTVFFGRTGQTPEELYAGMDAADYVIAREGDRMYVTGGSDYAMKGAVKTIGEMLERENAALPVTYRAQEGQGALCLRVGTFNIQNGSGVGHNWQVLAGDLIAADLDVVGLQEVDIGTGRVGGADSLAELAKRAGYEYYAFTKAIDLSGGEYGTGILSRYPIESHESVLLPSTGEQRAYGHAVIRVGERTFDFFNTHLAWPDRTERLNQMRALSAAFKKTSRAVLVGDFNTDGTVDLKKFFKDVQFVNGDKGQENYYISCPDDGAIDNILLKEDAVILDVTLDNGKVHSDHFLLYATIVLPDEG